MDNIITDIRKKLKRNFNKKNIKSIQKFFKEKIKTRGVKTAKISP